MSTLTPYAQPTILELSKNVDAYGRVIPVINVLAKKRGFLEDLPWAEANQPTSHKTSKSSYLGSGGTWRSFNQGIGITNPRTIEELNTLGMLENYHEIDAALCRLATNPREFRNQKATMILEAMAQEVNATILYGNHSAAPSEFYGLNVRMDSLNSYNVLGCGDTSTNSTSVYVVQPGIGQVWLAYPKGHPTIGIEHTDQGEVTSSTATTAAFNTAMLQVLRDHFKINVGLIVEDERCIGRVANIATSGTDNLFDPDKLIEVINNMKDGGAGGIIYVNRKVKTQMQIQAKDKTNIHYTFDNGDGYSGGPVLRFDGLPVHLDESILNTEDYIS
jgi:hypothetical protein